MAVDKWSIVDWDALGELEDWNRAWRDTLDSGLSERYVPGEGDNPRVLIVGEAPGAQEDSALRPFVGDAGRVLRDLMAGVGLFTGETPHFGLPNCWLTNLVHFRPPGNRNPLDAEVTIARMGLRDEWIAVGQPEIIVPVGKIPTQAIFGKKMSILRVAGSLIEHRSREGKKLKIWPMIHPSFGLRNKSMIPMIEKDWDKFHAWFRKIGRTSGKIYVDQYPDWLGVPKKWVDGGHLFGTDLELLHEFAKGIGLKREWYQGRQFPHYDLTKNKRALAIKKGAIPLDPGIIPEGVVRHDPNP